MFSRSVPVNYDRESRGTTHAGSESSDKAREQHETACSKVAVASNGGGWRVTGGEGGGGARGEGGGEWALARVAKALARVAKAAARAPAQGPAG